MASTTVPLAFNGRVLKSVKQETSQSPPHPQPEPPHSTVKPKSQELPPLESRSHLQQQSKEPVLLHSVSKLASLSSAIDTFNRRFLELQNHLDFIQQTMDTYSTQSSGPSAATPPDPVDPSPQKTTEIVAVAEKKSPPLVPKSEIRSLCEMMCGKGLRKYVISNMAANVQTLREEVSAALRYAPNPAKLVLDCIGRFYLQGKRAYMMDSPMITARDASIMVLEFFLLSLEGDEAVMDASVKQEADNAAVSWRRRLITEGGMKRASEVDAKGLLLLVAGYGIPKMFSDEEIWDLATHCDSKSIGEALRKSGALVKRVSDILDRMMKKGMEVEAVDVACTFGIDEKFSARKILTSVLRDAKVPTRSRKNPIIQREANERELNAVKSVLRFIEDHKLDPTKLLPGWQLKETIAKLKKDIAALDKQIYEEALKRKNDEIALVKRKNDEIELYNSVSKESKRARLTGAVPWISSSRIGMVEQRNNSHLGDQSSYAGFRQMHFVDSGLSGNTDNYPARGSVSYRAAVGSLPENYPGAMAGGGITDGSRVGLSVVYGVASAGSSAGVQREILVDRAGQAVSHNGLPYGWHGAVLGEGSQGQTYIHQTEPGLYEQSSMDGFAGLPNSSPSVTANRRSAADLYGFADSVIDGTYSSTHSAGLLPPGVESHHSSYILHR